MTGNVSRTVLNIPSNHRHLHHNRRQNHHNHHCHNHLFLQPKQWTQFTVSTNTETTWIANVLYVTITHKKSAVFPTVLMTSQHHEPMTHSIDKWASAINTFLRSSLLKVMVGFLYSTAYAITGPTRFTISEVAVDWQEPMVLQR